MNPQHNPMSLLIAAHEPSQGMALADMIHKLRPRADISIFQQPPAEVAPTLALIVASGSHELAELCGRVRAHYPEITVIVIAPRLDENAIEAAAGVGAVAFVASPCEPGALLRVLKTEERKVRFSGRCSEVGTSELLRLYATAASTGVLHLRAGEQSGAIHLEEGQPVDAHCGDQRGAEAVSAMLAWTGAKATWIVGRSASARTIIGRLEGLLEREADEVENTAPTRAAPADVIRKLENLAGIEDILGAYLLHNTEIIIGHNDSGLDEVVIGRALGRLAQVFHDMEDLQGDGAGTEIQATVGVHRLVVDRIGPTRLGFQVGVVVRQATPVCKSLRRLLRQMDRSFRRSLSASARKQISGGGSSSGSAVRPPSNEKREAEGYHRVA